MPANEEPISPLEGKVPVDISGNYQPVHLQDTLGVIFLGLLSLLLLIGWRRSETRYRKLIVQQASLVEKRPQIQ
jgi:hypothetical protein